MMGDVGHLTSNLYANDISLYLSTLPLLPYFLHFWHYLIFLVEWLTAVEVTPLSIFDLEPLESVFMH